HYCTKGFPAVLFREPIQRRFRLSLVWRPIGFEEVFGPCEEAKMVPLPFGNGKPGVATKTVGGAENVAVLERSVDLVGFCVVDNSLLHSLGGDDDYLLIPTKSWLRVGPPRSFADELLLHEDPCLLGTS